MYRFARRLAGRGHDWLGRPGLVSWRQRCFRGLRLAGVVYLVMALAIFDFTGHASPYDEETFEGRTVAIGPRPRLGMPGATRGWDVSGGFDYSEDAWPFVVWKPVCVGYCRARGFELPASWR